MMRCIIDEAESWKGSNPELVLPDAAEPSATSEMEGIASATVHAAHSLSELFRPVIGLSCTLQHPVEHSPADAQHVFHTPVQVTEVDGNLSIRVAD